MTERSDQHMDSANTPELSEFLTRSIARMGQQEENRTATGQALVAQVSELTKPLQQLARPTAPISPPVPPDLPGSSAYPRLSHILVS